jgi:hypothetical protein
MKRRFDLRLRHELHDRTRGAARAPFAIALFACALLACTRTPSGPAPDGERPATERGPRPVEGPVGGPMPVDSPTGAAGDSANRASAADKETRAVK